MPQKRCTATSRSGRSLQEYLALSGETLELELNSLILVLTGTKDEKAVRLCNHWNETRTDVDEGTQSTSKTELPIASAGSHEPNTRVGRKRKRVQKELKQSATSPLFSAEQQQFLSELVTKMVQAEKSQVDVVGAQVQTQRVPAEQISRNQQQTSLKSKCRSLARGEASTPEISEDEEDVERPTPRHTQTGMHSDQSHTLHSVYPVSEKWVRKILRSEFVDFDALLAKCPSSILYAASAMADQSQVALEVGTAGLSVAQKHQRRLVTDITSWLTAWSLFATR